MGADAAECGGAERHPGQAGGKDAGFVVQPLRLVADDRDGHGIEHDVGEPGHQWRDCDEDGEQHSRAVAREQRADVRVTYAAWELRIEVVDDGVAEAAVNGRGHGLIGMRERVAVFGGELTAGRDPAGGFRLRARLPLRGPQP